MSSRARWNLVMHSRPVVQLELDLRDAYAVGRVLADAADLAEDARLAARLRQRSDGLLCVGIAPGMREAEEIAEALEGAADPVAESGRRALAVAAAITATVERARAQDAMGGLGPWAPVARLHGDTDETRTATDGHGRETPESAR